MLENIILTVILLRLTNNSQPYFYKVIHIQLSHKRSVIIVFEIFSQNLVTEIHYFFFIYYKGFLVWSPKNHFRVLLFPQNVVENFYEFWSFPSLSFVLGLNLDSVVAFNYAKTLFAINHNDGISFYTFDATKIRNRSNTWRPIRLKNFF